MLKTQNCHNWMIEEMDATFAAVAIDLHNLDAVLHEIEHADCACEGCMAIAKSYVGRLSEISRNYESWWKDIEANKAKSH